jgi:serine/threonine-protein kinase HipA
LRLWSRLRKGRESATLEYDRGWLEHAERFALEPALVLGPGPQHTAADQSLFGALGDSAPDRWGRALMRRSERRRPERHRVSPHTLGEIDYLLMVDDEARQGALRFAEREGGPFLAPPGEGRIPPLVELPRLLSASDHVTSETDEELQRLLAPGSSLGGARPKTVVRDRDGSLAVVKFPHQSDEVDVERWEAVALALAGRAGIAVPEWRIEIVSGKAVLLLRRFDRRLRLAPRSRPAGLERRCDRSDEVGLRTRRSGNRTRAAMNYPLSSSSARCSTSAGGSSTGGAPFGS